MQNFQKGIKLRSREKEQDTILINLDRTHKTTQQLYLQMAAVFEELG
jgi:hypothetical protein